jgi:hypothetical protein
MILALTTGDDRVVGADESDRLLADQREERRVVHPERHE